MTKEQVVALCQFIEAVHQMRGAQKLYFKNRQIPDMRRAQALEKEVDTLLRQGVRDLADSLARPDTQQSLEL